MKGISAVIAIVLILMLTISLSAMGYIWMSDTFTDVSKEAYETTQEVSQKVHGSLIIESTKGSIVYTRNTGEINLTGFDVYIDDDEVYFEKHFGDYLAPGEMGVIKLGAYDGYEEITRSIRITTAQGISSSKKNIINSCENDDLVLCYTFDDISGTTVKDGSSYENDGIISGDPIYVPGVSGKAIKFDGVDDYVTVADSMISDDFTLEAWVKSDTNIYPGWWQLISDYSRFILGSTTPDSNSLRFAMATQSSGWQYATTYNPTVSEINNWHHIVVTRNSSSGEVKLYFNGELKSINVMDVNPLRTDNRDLDIGRRNYDEDPYFFDGYIDEVRIYNRTLTDGEVRFRNKTATPETLDVFTPPEYCDLVCDNLDCVNNNNTAGTYICLTQDLVSDDNAVILGADEQTLDCLDFSIIGPGGYDSVGINSTLRDNVVIKNCYVYNFGNGLFVENSNHADLSNNTLFKNYRGIYTKRSNYSNIYDNCFYNQTGSAINLDFNNNNNIHDNLFEYNKYGVYLNSYVSDHIITSNVIRNSVYDAIPVLSSCVNVTIDGNLFEYNGQYAIWLQQSGAVNNYIINNDINNNVNGGVRISSPNNIMINNTLNNNMNNAIRVTRENNVIVNNTCYNSTNGINIQGGSNNLIENNTLYGHSYGLSISTDNNIINNNLIYDNEFDGIYLLDSADGNVFTNTYSCDNNQAGGSYYDVNDLGTNSFTSTTCDTANGATCDLFCP